MYQQQKVNIPISEGGVTVKVIKGTGYVYYTTEESCKSAGPKAFLRGENPDEEDE